jgi:uncharacterized protein (DUF1800 family)
MGNPSAVLSDVEARHLLRRSGFGASAAHVSQFTGMMRGTAADTLLSFKTSKFKPVGQYIEDRHDSWLRQMLSTAFPLREKLVLFWHDHFAASNDKVQDPRLMANQNQLLRKFCKGNFKDFVKAINKDAAMLEFLDTVRNSKDQPNENYARELQELFTLGVTDYNGNRTYEQADIVQIARAFSGWDYTSKGVAFFNADDHDFTADYPERGAKVIYKQYGGFGAAGIDYTQPPNNPDGMEGAGEIDAVVEIIFQHRHTDADTSTHRTVARYIAGKLFTFFAQPNPKRPADMTQAQRNALRPIVDTVISDSQFDQTWDISALLHAIFVNDAFYATAVAADPQNGFSATDLKSVKWPVDYVVSTMRLLNVKLARSRYGAYVAGGDYARISDQLDNMGQVLFEPPSVFGWDWETAWINSATLLARSQFAVDVIAARGTGRTKFHPERLVSTSLTDPAQIVTAVTDVLGVTDQLTDTDRATLVDYLTDGAGSGTLDLTDDDTRNRKLNGLFGLVLQSPAYQLH